MGRTARADENIEAQDRHLGEAVESGDATHHEARAAMKGRWRRPRQSWGWYGDTGRSSAELPDS